MVTGLRRMPALPQGLPQSQAAIEFAERVHAGQHRGDGAPFILHPLEVASLLDHAGGADHLVAADKLSKLRELRREAAADSRDSITPGRVRKLRARRLRHYRRSLALLEERIPSSPLVRELRDELNALLRNRDLAAAL